jgi:nicotinamidase-related amidase
MLELAPLTPESTALLVVDIQERLMPAMPGGDARRLVASVDLLIDAAGRLGMPVVVTEQYPKGLGPTVAPIEKALAALDPHAVRAEKTAFSALAAPAVAETLTARKGAFKAVIVVGVEAHVCVYQTARDLRHTGLPVYVPFDAVASRDPACRATALALLTKAGVAVTTTETLVFDLMRSSTHPAFKALSAKVKELPLG